jgi:site-specific recombinase XerD
MGGAMNSWDRVLEDSQGKAVGAAVGSRFFSEALVKGVKKKGAAFVKTVACRIAEDSPRLADLGVEELQKLARVVVAESLKDDLRRAADLERVPYAAERERFLARASRTGSAHTQKAYGTALSKLESWCALEGVSPVGLTPALADNWIEAEKAQGRAPSSVRLAVAGASVFFTWLERRHPEVRNPFRGSRARPLNKPRRKLAVPSEAEIGELQAAADPVLRAAIATMNGAGLRVGGLPALTIYGERFTTTTKGKEQSGVLPGEARREIERAGLSLRLPFAGKTAQQIADRFRYLAKRLQGDGKIRERYSVHDLRHAFAVRRYQETRDVYAVEKALGHANIAVTERYLRSLGLEGMTA